MSFCNKRPGSWNIKGVLLTKENQTSLLKEFGAFLCKGRYEHLGSLKSCFGYAALLSGASIMCFLIGVSSGFVVQGCCSHLTARWAWQWAAPLSPSFFFFFKLYIIVLVFAKYQNESATGIHVSPSWVPSGLTVRAAVISWLDGSNVLCLLIELQYFSSHPCVGLSQERLVLSVLPRFVVLEMINDMTNVEDEHLQHQFHRIYIHRYENVRWATRPPPRSLPWLLSPHHHDFCLPKCQRLSSCDWLTH